MLTISSLKNKFEKLDTNSIIEESLYETRGQFEAANAEQMMQGLRKDQTLIRPSYKNENYAKKKHQMNPKPVYKTPDLHLTGSFHSMLNAIVEGEKIFIFSNDEKGPMLEEKYPDIFGLGGSYRSDFLAENLGPAVQRKISNFTGLKIK